jgi:branched-chain amino acid transport system substrate-binding protein
MSANDAIAIGVCGPYVGGSAAMGTSMRDGVLLAIDGVNRRGGVHGRPLEPLVRDDQASVEVADRLARELIDAGVAATVGFINTDPALSATRFYQQAERPVIVNCTAGIGIAQQFAGPAHAHNYVFRIAMDDGVIAAVIADHVFHRLGRRRPAIFAASAYYGESSRQDLSRRFGAFGTPVVAQEAFELGDRDMKAQIERARAAEADVVVTFGVGPEVASIVRGMAEIGWRVPVIGSWPIGTSTFIDLAGEHAEGAMAPQTFIEAPTTPGRKAFIESYRARYEVDRIPCAIAAAQGYDSVLIVAAAIAQAGTTGGRELRAALEALEAPVEGIVTTYSKPFTKDDHEAVTKNIPVVGVVRGARMTFWSEDEARNAHVPRMRNDACKP